MQMVMRLGLRLVATGLAIGMGLSLLTNRVLVSQLWRTSPHDPTTFLAAASMVVVIGALACWLPARRAMRVEPMAALRQD